MNRITIAIIAVAGTLAASMFASCVSFYDTANRLENSATAQAKSNRNAYDNMWKTVAEVAQIPDKYKADFKELLVAEAEAKGQDLLADKQRAYANHLGTVGGSMWAGITGHPKPISGKYAPIEDIDGDGELTVLDYPIITSARTEAVFEAGRDDEPMTVF